MKKNTLEKRNGFLKEHISDILEIIFKEKQEKKMIMKVTLMMIVNMIRTLIWLRSCRSLRKGSERGITIPWVLLTHSNTLVIKFILRIPFLILTQKLFLIWFKERKFWKLQKILQKFKKVQKRILLKKKSWYP